MKVLKFDKNFSFILDYIVVISLLSSFSYFLSLYLQSSKSFVNQISSIIQTTQISIIFVQSILLVGAAILMAIIILFLLIKKNYILIRYIFVLLICFSILYINILYFNPLYNLFLNIEYNLLIYLIIIFISSLLSYGVFYAKSNIYNEISLITITSQIGALLGNIFNILQTTIILILFSIYDIFSVFWGPIGKIVSNLENEEKYNLSLDSKESELFLHGMFLRISNIEIGIGDLVFYSMLISNVTSLGVIPLIFALVGISLGYFITINMTKKFRIFPGLPIPVIISLALIWIFIYL